MDNFSGTHNLFLISHVISFSFSHLTLTKPTGSFIKSSRWRKVSFDPAAARGLAAKAAGTSARLRSLQASRQIRPEGGAAASLESCPAGAARAAARLARIFGKLLLVRCGDGPTAGGADSSVKNHPSTEPWSG